MTYRVHNGRALVAPEVQSPAWTVQLVADPVPLHGLLTVWTGHSRRTVFSHWSLVNVAFLSWRTGPSLVNKGSGASSPFVFCLILLMSLILSPSKKLSDVFHFIHRLLTLSLLFTTDRLCQDSWDFRPRISAGNVGLCDQ